MDKNTLGNYGRVIVCVLIICAMIALASPFGNYIKGTIWDIVGSFSGTEVSDDDAIGVVDSNNTITLKGTLPADTYTLKYENESGVMTEYSEICTLEITDSGENAVYEGLIAENSAPVGASAIGVYNSADERVGEFGLGSLAAKGLGEKLYSFGAISDTHIGYDTAEDDFKNALTYFENETNVGFIVNCGDMSLNGTAARLTTYKTIVNTFTTKNIYEVTGNHEANSGYLAMDAMQPYTGEDLYYSFTNGDDVYIMVGMYDVHDGAEFSEEEIQWLYETLETNKDKRCFVFMHLNPGNGSGDAENLDPEGDMLNNLRGDVFYTLMSHYSNVTWFHGHTHQEFKTQEINKMNTYDNVLGTHSVHIPSLSVTKQIVDGGLVNNYSGSEGYVVDVYENNIVLKGRDFITGKFLPIATYSLDTTKKNVKAETYYDNTQTIVNSNSNMLKADAAWYEGCSIEKAQITKVSFSKNSAPSTYDECWDASISENNQVMAYRSGTEITIVGNKNGIMANKSTNYFFKDFTGLTRIDGLENFNTANAREFIEVFRNCKKMESIDISSLNLRYALRLNGLFAGCSKLTSVKLPENIGINGKDVNAIGRYVLQGMFEDCISIKTIDVSMLMNKAAHITNMFKDCSSLEEVKFGELKVVAAANVFYRCKALTKVDMDKVDFSSCETMLQMFTGCSVLNLDCSGWDTANCTDITNFNNGAPGVIAPTLN